MFAPNDGSRVILLILYISSRHYKVLPLNDKKGEVLKRLHLFKNKFYDDVNPAGLSWSFFDYKLVGKLFTWFDCNLDLIAWLEYVELTVGAFPLITPLTKQNYTLENLLAFTRLQLDLFWTKFFNFTNGIMRLLSTLDIPQCR